MIKEGAYFVKIRKVAKYCMLLCLFLLYFILPIENISQNIQSIEARQFLLFGYLTLILAFLFLLFAVSNENSFKITQIDLLLISLVLIIIINRNFIQPDHVFSLHYYELFGLTIIYVTLRNINRISYMILLFAIILCASVEAFTGYLQIAGYKISNNENFQLTGNFPNPGALAGFLVSTIAVFFAGYNGILKDELRRYYPRAKFIISTLPIILLAASVFILIIIACTASRAAWFSVIIFMLLVHFSKMLNKVLGLPKFYRLALLSILSIALCFVIGKVYLMKKNSADGRILVWKSTLHMICDRPFTGVGLDRFKSFYMLYQSDELKHQRSESYADFAGETIYAFNDPLQLFAENGVLAGIIVVMLFIILMRTNIKRDCGYGVLCKYSLISIGFFSLFSYPSAILLVKMNVLFSIAYLVQYHKPVFTFKIHLSLYKRVFQIGLICSCLLMIIILWKKNDRLRKDYYIWNEALECYRDGDYGNAVAFYKKVYPTFNKEGDFLMQYGKTLEIYREHILALTILNRAVACHNTYFLQCAIGDAYKSLKQYPEAEAAYKKASLMIPAKFYAEYLLANLYVETNQNEKARLIAQHLLKKKIKVNSEAVNDILRQMREIELKLKIPDK
ncbi:O-antigen ligase family protein [Chitinophaga sp. 30R24]|uniref:O-antigen ligase family protein n=1 Tax=Chitinophaga sp. 30R24 TaxID=3248838 RepID=UPI003B9017CC